jgi:hypothetical protein
MTPMHNLAAAAATSPDIHLVTAWAGKHLLIVAAGAVVLFLLLRRRSN